jgi:lipopolysaccharide transport system ATP-binding protein
VPKPIIEVKGVSKTYRLGVIGPTSLNDEIGRLWSRIRRRSRRELTPRQCDIFWALRDVSFDVQSGTVVGIIGRNGAGKSTLLKILSRITQQTTGKITLRGRVASLLEVGTGFHPDLTGRENVLLNGAILGMTKAEIRAKFDAIIAFAEVEQFIDTPVKRYSSGMYVRLAFAVAAYLEPEILIVDEVLAVGDGAFQKKCLGKIGAVSREGRTVLFVSHNLLAIRSLCSRAILLTDGTVTADGACEVVTRRYLADGQTASGTSLAERNDRRGTGLVRFLSVMLRDGDGAAVAAFHCGETAILVLRFENRAGRDLRRVVVGVGIDEATGQRITLLESQATDDIPEIIPSEIDTIEARIDRLPLMPGRYAFTLYFAVNGEAADWIHNAGTFDVEPGDYFHTGRFVHDQGYCLVDQHFSLGTAGEGVVDEPSLRLGVS